MTNYLVFDCQRNSYKYTAKNGSDAQAMAKNDGIKARMVVLDKQKDLTRYLRQ